MTGQGIEVRVAFRNMVRALGFVGVAGILAMLWAGPVAAQTQTQTKTRNVVLIVSDGLRWQEMFTGADATLMDSEHGGIWADPDELRKKFWRDDVAARREALFPFLWGTVAKQGEIFGNQNKGSVARVTNGMAFSYPGYNEMISGHADPRIDSNEFGPNPNVNVFEWLDHLPDLRDRPLCMARGASLRTSSM
jgi:hypothetical protein